MSNTQSQIAGMGQLQRLKALQEESKAKAQTSNMTAFNDLVGVYVGASAREHFPKLKRTRMGKRSKMTKDATSVATRLTDILTCSVSSVLRR